MTDKATQKNVSLLVSCLLMLWYCHRLVAQILPYQFVGEIPKKYFHYLPKTTLGDSLRDSKQLQEVLMYFQKRGYLLANIDSTEYLSDVRKVNFHLGKRYQWLQIRNNVPIALQQAANIKPQLLTQKNITPKQWNALHHQLLDYAENNGFPFAEVRFDSVQIIDNKISAFLHYQPYFQVLNDTVILEGDVKIRYPYFLSVVRIKPRQPFSQQRVNKAQIALKQLPYLRITKPPLLAFTDNKAQINFYAQQRKANQIDGILGILPNAQQNTQTIITGQLELKLHNLLQSGKHIHIKWQRPNVNSQQLYTEYEHPHFLRTGVTITAKLDILREDSTFQNVSQEIRFGYPTYYAGVFSFFARSFSSSVGVRNSNSTNVASTNFTAYGIGYHFQNLDDVLYPRNGWLLRVDISVGNKISRQRLTDTTFLFSGVQSLAQAEMSRYVKQTPKTTLLLRLRTAWINHPHLFLNDLYRIGGINSFRGFNENTYFTQWHHLQTIEQRLYTEEESYFFIFSDIALLRNGIREVSREQLPWSIGAGLSFTTKAGIFSLVYAIGKSAEQPFSTRFSKIHFGLISRF